MAQPAQPVKPKTQIMADIQAAVSSSALTNVVVANPWNTVNQKNDLRTQSGYNAWAPDTMGPNDPPQSIKPVMKMALDPELRNKSDAEIYPALRKKYLKVGKERLTAAGKTSIDATCPDISCLVVTLLGAKFEELLRPDSTLEVCKMFTLGQSPHYLVVVNRVPGSTLNDPNTWGPEAFIVDQWYALQRNTPAGTQAVKDIDQNSAFYDQDFIDFFTASRLGKPLRIERSGLFTVGDFGS